MYLITALLHSPWPWYIAGPLIGLTVPALLLSGNKKLGVSSSLRDICAACVPADIPFLHYDWKKNSWNLFFVAGILIGGFIAGQVFANPLPVAISPATVRDLHSLDVRTGSGLLPANLFNWH
ncbi:MAG TPA: YeeE/YedE thiosulfate transporter family protein, partial [Chitinophagaceae bacterium]|nr:YeeE/YedE thiosulfate transporter family protein [Chitinophagaceae bacterium]